MSQSVIGALRVNLGLDSAQFKRGMSEAQKNLEVARTKFLAVAGVAAAMGAALSTAALAGASQIDALAKSARRLDSSVGGFRALELAAGEAGVSLSTLTDAVQTMDREIAKGSKGASEALKALNLTARDLQGIDADEKMAVLADAIEEMGLSTAQSSVVLQQLGVRNREMVLAVGAGGEAFRQARADIESYGLAISQTDSDAIEKANDRIGRLGLISQYAGQQLAIALVPAMGEMAQAMTDSLREGGALRAVIDGLIDNLSTLAGTATVLVGVMGTKYVAAFAAARGVTFSLVGALTALKGAIFATGFGALVIGAGYLVGKFSDLVFATGGWGNALEALGDLAAGVWAGITKSAEAIPPAMSAIWEMVASSFFGVMSRIHETWSRFLGNLGADMADIPGMGAFADKILETSGKAASAMSEFDGKAESAAASAGRLKAEASALAVEGFEMARAAGAKLAAIVSETSDEVDGGADSTEDLNDALNDVGGSGGSAGKAAKALEKVKTEAEAYNDALKDAALTSEDIGTKKANIMISGIDGVANAFGDFIGRGLTGFKDFAKSILSSFTGMISQMVAMAARQKIMLSLGITSSGVGGAASAGVPGGGGILGGGGGILGSIGGGIGALTSGIGAGFNMAVGGFMSGGLGGLTGVIGTQMGAATATMGAFGAAIGAIAAPLLAVAAVFSFFKKKTKELDAGLRVTVDGLDAMVQTFRTIETKKFWGLSKKVSTSYGNAAAEVAAPLQKAISDIGNSIIGLGQVVGLDAANIDKASFRFNVSTRGKSEEEIQKAVAAEMERLSDVFADAMVGTISSSNPFSGKGGILGVIGSALGSSTSQVNEAFEALKRAGEGSYDALSRIVVSLQTVNPAMRALGLNLYEMSLAGGDLASTFADRFGGLQGFGEFMGSYYDDFYTAQERARHSTKLMVEQLSDLGINALPASRAAFRALVDEADSLGDSELVASLIKLSPAFAEITAASDALSASLANNTLFRTKADQIYAQTAGGYRASLEDIQTAAGDDVTALLNEVVRAIREGDQSNARLTNQLFNQMRRAALEPGT
ncbi:hypothetical protein [Sulfitobacter sp. M22]|uniref:hypothetical protein n=1 Tax=Sulfitobacter sp. M22 TaxID=2675332 RepID=UPI001F3F2845|nr:hypothetical protein [Sulfitobacter sp. M22]MCF7725783.1 hypothetical protein [Sulfitobacter sp. M22]